MMNVDGVVKQQMREIWNSKVRSLVIKEVVKRNTKM